MQDVVIFGFLQGSRTKVLAWAAVFIAAIALVDWHFEENISFGFLYLFPMIMVGGCLTRLQMARRSSSVHGIDGGVRSISMGDASWHLATHTHVRGVFWHRSLWFRVGA